MSCDFNKCGGCSCFINAPCSHCEEDHENINGIPECEICEERCEELNDDGICPDCAKPDDRGDGDYNERGGYSKSYINYLNSQLN